MRSDSQPSPSTRPDFSPTCQDSYAPPPPTDQAREITNLSFVNLTDRYGLLTFGAVGLWLLVTSLACLPAAVPTWLKATGGLVTFVFLTVAAFEGSWTSVLAGIAALTLAPTFFGGLAARARAPRNNRPAESPAGTT